MDKKRTLVVSAHAASFCSRAGETIKYAEAFKRYRLLVPGFFP
jgi:hypothetical protein